MKETISRVVVEMDAINPTTGELFKIHGVNEEQNRYYSVRKLTSRINAMDLFSLMENVCKSSKDIHMMNILTERVTRENELRIDNITNLASDLDVSRVKLTTFLKSLVDSNFLHKLDVGVYLVNPYVFVGRRVKSNELREAAQHRWLDFLETNKTKG